jgi:hypothetical protein
MITIAAQGLEIGPQTPSFNGSSHCGVGQGLTVNRGGQAAPKGRPRATQAPIKRLGLHGW